MIVIPRNGLHETARAQSGCPLTTQQGVTVWPMPSRASAIDRFIASLSNTVLNTWPLRDNAFSICVRSLAAILGRD